MQRTEKVIEIDAPVERVFDFFSDFESFPRWMRNIKEVRHTGRRYTRWTADAPFGSSVEWEAETTSFEPDHRIAWRSVRGDVYTEGEVLFKETRRGTTRLRIVLGYDPPAGRLGALVASLFGKDPEQQLEEDLERFAEVVEGSRRRVRRARYNGREGVRGAAQPRREEKRRGGLREDFAGRDARQDYYARDERRRDGRDEEHGRARDQEEDYERRRERVSRQRFDEALREARRSQLEGRRRYREERERDEQHRDSARRGREWERERETRQPDYDYSRKAFRRGFDKLMDEPPSKRWRRWD